MRRWSEHLPLQSAFATNVPPSWRDDDPLGPELGALQETPLEEYSYTSGRLDGLADACEGAPCDIRLSSGGSWPGGNLRCEMPTWKQPSDVRLMPCRPITLTVQPPRSNKVITIHPNQAPPTLKTAPVNSTPFALAKRSARGDVLGGMEGRKKLRQVTTGKSMSREADMRRAFSSPNRFLEPGEISGESCASTTQSNLQWCTDVSDLTPVDSSFQGREHCKKSWHAVEHELRPFVVHSFEI